MAEALVAVRLQGVELEDNLTQRKEKRDRDRHVKGEGRQKKTLTLTTEIHRVEIETSTGTPTGQEATWQCGPMEDKQEKSKVRRPKHHLFIQATSLQFYPWLEISPSSEMRQQRPFWGPI